MVSSSSNNNENNNTIRKFIWLSDIHYDPYYGQRQAAGGEHCKKSGSKYGQIGCDTPRALIEDVLSNMKDEWIDIDSDTNTIDFVLITGCFCGHNTAKLNNPMNETITMLRDLSNMIIRSTSNNNNISIIPSLGNNDVIPDYYIDTKNATVLLSMITDAFQPFFINEEERRTFSKGGYMARNVNRVTVLSLNTIIYSSNHQLAAEEEEDPLDQFHWLKQQLDISRRSNKIVYIVGHVCPTVGSFRHQQMWHSSYLLTYNSILQNYSDIITGQLYGHLHSDEFRLPPSSVEISPILITSSITPMYTTNPSYRLVQYDSINGTILDYNTKYMDLINNNNTLENTTTTTSPTWIDALSFREEFSVPDMSRKSLQSIVTNFSNNRHIFLSRQTSQYNSSNNNNTSLLLQCNEDCQKDWICVIQSSSLHDYTTCLNNNNSKRNNNVVFIIIILIAFVGIISLIIKRIIYNFKQWWNRRYYHESKISETSPIEDIRRGGYVILAVV